MSLFALIIYKSLYDLTPLVRSITTLNAMVMLVQLGGVFWSIFSILNRGHGPFLIPAVGFIASFVLDHELNMKFNFHQFNLIRGLSIAIVFWLTILSFYGLARTGFWEKMDASDSDTITTDPNHNLWWVTMRISSVLFYPPLILFRTNRQKADMILEAPLNV
jgi:FtsH-binding integral membrane protein